MKRGIDVSIFQSGINWERVKASGVDFAMIKATQGRSEQNASLRLFTDSYFIRNMLGAGKAGIEIGVYHYLTAQTVGEAIEEADYFLSVIAPYRNAINLYAAVDVESKYLPNNKTLLTQIVHAFCKKVMANGYTPIVYTNPNFLKNRLNDIGIWKLWLALWSDKKNVPTKADYPNIRIWQWGAESVDGIGGTVDSNFEIQEKIETEATEETEKTEETKEKEEDETVQETNEKSQEVSEWAKDAMDWAVKMGFIQGDENGNLMPRDPITREQFAVVIHRVMQHISGM